MIGELANPSKRTSREQALPSLGRVIHLEKKWNSQLAYGGRNSTMSTGRLVVGVTGASGAIYAQRFLMAVESSFETIHLVLSDQAMQVAATELGISLNRQSWSTLDWLGFESKKIKLLKERDYFTPPASGSYRHDGMVIVPCSMGTIGRVASGISNDLLTRSADVCLKERRPLILVPREMPMNLIMLRNLTTLSEAGATILPACPAWYGRPETLNELADTVVARILQQLKIGHSLFPEWQTAQNQAVEEGIGGGDQ